MALALIATAVLLPSLPVVADDFAACEERITAEPGRRDAGYCFFEAARASGAWDEAAAYLRRHLDRSPRDPWLHYYLANVLWASRAPEVVELYRSAAELFEAAGESAAASRSWLNLAYFLRLTDRSAEAAGGLERAVAAARAAGDRMLLATVEIEQVRQELQEDQDFARAYWQLRRIEEVAFPDGPYELKRDCLTTLGMVAHNLGRWDEVRSYARRGVELGRAKGDRYYEVTMLHSLAAADLADPVNVDREALIEQYVELLQAARRAGHRMVQAQALLDLGRLRGGEEGRRLLEECVEISRELGQDVQLSGCLRGLAVLVADDDPAYASSLLDEALSRALAAGDPWPMVYGWVERLVVRWKTLPRQAALDDSLRALDLIETLRQLQGSQTGRLGVGTVWSEAYNWLSGRLLGSEPTRDELELAFTLAERARARSLLEELAAPPAGTAATGADAAEYRNVVQQIVEVHRGLLDGSTPERERRGLLDRLDDLESQEASLREASRVAAGIPDFVQLNDVQHALAADEALLAFQLSPWEDRYGEAGSGSWVWVVTKVDERTYPIPDRAELQPATDVFLGTLQRRDGSDLLAAAALGERVLGPAMADLPPDIRSLILVPDGPLHQVPFAALRTVAGGPTLVERYRLTTVPSAALWLGWRLEPPRSSLGGALVLADPLPAGADLADGSSSWDVASQRNWALAAGGHPGALPQARREGRRIAALLGTGSRVLVGEEASEARVKADLGVFGALHFAAHALVDGERPQRSAVLLAPGDGAEDGLLQAREIAALHLDDRLVVLSACRSASGAVLQGEGPMSLARAFFQGGARAVVAAPWPLRDTEARRLTEALYRRLARGVELADALAEAQREELRLGLPAAAWAGLELYGDGSWAPFAARPSREGWSLAIVVSLAAAGLAVVVVLLRRRS